MSNPRFHKPTVSNDKITFVTKTSTFITRIKPFPYDVDAMDYINNRAEGDFNGVRVTTGFDDSRRLVEISFSSTADFEACDREFRNTLVKISGYSALTSNDREKILRAYTNFLRSCGVKSELEAVVHRLPGMDHGSAY